MSGAPKQGSVQTTVRDGKVFTVTVLPEVKRRKKRKPGARREPRRAWVCFACKVIRHGQPVREGKGWKLCSVCHADYLENRRLDRDWRDAVERAL